jgi:SAM-dependent methyltransferase
LASAAFRGILTPNAAQNGESKYKMKNTKNQTDSATMRVKVFSSSSNEYAKAFSTFLACTDQKEKAMAHLDQEIGKLSRKTTFVDAGAGTGKLTAHFAKNFKETIAIEPNPSLISELRNNCPGVAIVEKSINDARVEPAVDFVLCSHVFYYLPKGDWLNTLRKMSDWLAVDGVLAVALQNADTDCMRMLDHFLGQRFDLKALASEFSDSGSDQMTVSLATVPAKIKTSSFENACTIAEFMLNLLHMPNPPLASALEAYVQTHFCHSGGYEFSCHQDFLWIKRHGGV